MSFLQVASWNIEHLSGASRANRRQSAYALADHIEMAGVDLIVLQEIYVTPEDEEVRLFENRPVIKTRAKPGSGRRNSDLDIVCYLLEEHLRSPWQYVILPNRDPGDESQLCAAMWNTSRLRLNDILPLNVSHLDGEDRLWDRRPHLLSFSSDIKVWRRAEDGKWEQQGESRTISVVPLHMKSNVGGATKNRLVREKEAATLCDAVKEVWDKIDHSLMMLGDTNILRHDEPALEVFVTRGFIDLNNNDSTTFWSKDFGESPFDRVLVWKDRPEFRYTRQYVLRSSDLLLHDRFLSDHYMIKVSVKDYIDDADPR